MPITASAAMRGFFFISAVIIALAAGITLQTYFLYSLICVIIKRYNVVFTVVTCYYL